MRFIVRITIVGLLIFLAILNSNPAQPARATGAPEFEPGQVVVKLAPATDLSIDLINQLYGTRTIMSLSYRSDTFLLATPPGTNADQIVDLMSADPNLEYVELNFITGDPESGSTDRIYGWGGQNDEDYRGQDAVKKLGLQEAHAYSRGAGALVAILDTGVQLAHPQLVASLDGRGFDFVDNDPYPEDEANGIDDDGDGQVDEGYGHGTHVAGIVHLVAPEAGILPLRVLDSDGRGNSFRTAAAILYAAHNGAGVANLSLGTVNPSALFQDVVNEAARMGVLIVAATGNLDSDIRQYPAAQSCAVAVTSVSSNNNKKSSFSSYGAWVDLVAPGEYISSTYPLSGYAWASGTSMATPFVAGQAALLQSLDPQITLDQIGALLGGTARPVDAVNLPYRGLLGRGHIDLPASLQSLQSGNLPAAERSVLVDCSP